MYYVYYSNVSHGKRKKALADTIPCIIEPVLPDKAFRNN